MGIITTFFRIFVELSIERSELRPLGKITEFTFSQLNGHQSTLKGVFVYI